MVTQNISIERQALRACYRIIMLVAKNSGDLFLARFIKWLIIYIKPPNCKNIDNTFPVFSVRDRLSQVGIFHTKKDAFQNQNGHLPLITINMIASLSFGTLKVLYLFTVDNEYLLIALGDFTLAFGEVRIWSQVWTLMAYITLLLLCLRTSLLSNYLEHSDWLNWYNTPCSPNEVHNLVNLKSQVNRVWYIIWFFATCLILPAFVVIMIYPCFLASKAFQLATCSLSLTANLISVLAFKWSEIILFLFLSFNSLLDHRLTSMINNFTKMSGQSDILQNIHRYLNLQKAYYQANHVFSSTLGILYTVSVTISLIVVYQLFFTTVPFFPKLVLTSLLIYLLGAICAIPIFCRSTQLKITSSQRYITWLCVNKKLSVSTLIKLDNLYAMSIRYPMVIRFFDIYYYNSYNLVLTLTEMVCALLLIYLSAPRVD